MGNSPVPSPYSNPNPSHSSLASSSQRTSNTPITTNVMQPSPTIRSTSPSSYTAPKKRFLIAVKQETQDDKPQTIAEEEPAPLLPALQIIPDTDSPTKKSMSAFLIGTPSSNGASSSSSTSSHTHFNYEEVTPQKPRDSTPSSFQWPSQFRRQLSLNLKQPAINPTPSTPYTPPPMLSPFRKGPGLYYRVFSQPGPSTEGSSIPTTPINDESTSPKINIGKEYQATIPKLRTDPNDEMDVPKEDDGWLFKIET